MANRLFAPNGANSLRAPGPSKVMRVLAVLVLLAVPFAGCTAPTNPIPASAGAVAPAEGTHAVRALLADAPELPVAPGAATAVLPALPVAGLCPPSPRRTEDVQAARVRIQIDGCTAANEPLLLDGIPADPIIYFDIQPGALSVEGQFHLHDVSPLNLTLRDPRNASAWRDTAMGNQEQDSFLRFTLPRPEAGVWNLKSLIRDVALADRWTVVLIVQYPG